MKMTILSLSNSRFLTWVIASFSLITFLSACSHEPGIATISQDIDSLATSLGIEEYNQTISIEYIDFGLDSPPYYFQVNNHGGKPVKFASDYSSLIYGYSDKNEEWVSIENSTSYLGDGEIIYPADPQNNPEQAGSIIVSPTALSADPNEFEVIVILVSGQIVETNQPETGNFVYAISEFPK